MFEHLSMGTNFCTHWHTGTLTQRTSSPTTNVRSVISCPPCQSEHLVCVRNCLHTCTSGKTWSFRCVFGALRRGRYEVSNNLIRPMPVRTMNVHLRNYSSAASVRLMRHGPIMGSSSAQRIPACPVANGNRNQAPPVKPLHCKNP